MTDLRYPIGRFHHEGEVTVEQLQAAIQEITALPELLYKAVHGLTPDQMETPYRPGGWTLGQVVHHLADSHMNSMIRFKLALTEDEPTIKPYAEDKWALLPDSKTANVELSLQLLPSLHARWVLLLQSLSPAQLSRTFHHPDSGKVRLDVNILIYAWHGRHHLAHITSLRERMGW
ncbi:MAG: YfiT family bacillithiol transferase [Clostridia bacterium]